MIGARSNGVITLNINTAITPSSSSSTGFVVSNYSGTLSISSGTIGVRKVYKDGTYEETSTSGVTHDLSDCAGCAINTLEHSATITFTPIST